MVRIYEKTPAKPRISVLITLKSCSNYSTKCGEGQLEGLCTRSLLTLLNIYLDQTINGQTTTSPGALSNEEWLTESNTAKQDKCFLIAKISSNQACWIKAGYKQDTSKRSGGQYFFWADVRPLNNDCTSHCSYQEHILDNVKSSDMNNPLYILLINTGSTSPTDQWSVAIYAQVTYYNNQYSTANTMHPDQMAIGEELEGTRDASAPYAHFKNPEFCNFTCTYERSDGQFLGGQNLPHNPPAGGWNVRPSSGPYAGDFWACTESYSPC